MSDSAHKMHERRKAGTIARFLSATAALVAALAPLPGSVAASAETDGQVVVPRGQPVQIAVVLDKSGSFGASVRNAIEMAVQLNPTIRSFPIQLNDDFDGPCGTGSAAVALNASAAAAVVANAQNVAVIGHMCSYAFAAALPPGQGGCPSPAPTTALSIYESDGIVAINGSATNACLPSVGPAVFDRTAVADPGFDAWYDIVKTLPSDSLWRQAYQRKFGSAPTDFADLYFDATRLLLARIGQVSEIVDGNLVIDRAALAQAVRSTTNFSGVTCTVALDPATGNRVDDPAALALCARASATGTGSWIPAGQLGPVASGERPQLALDARGDAALAWEAWDGSANDVFVSYRAAGAPSWPAPVQLGSSGLSAEPKIALDSQGNAIALWLGWPAPGAHQVVTASFRPAATGRWQAPLTLAEGDSPITLGMDDAGDALAVWDGTPGASSFRPAGGAWQAPVALPTTQYSQAAIFHDGTMALAGYDYLPGNELAVQAAVGDRGRWGPVANVSGALLDSSLPAVAAGPGGSAIVAWDSNLHGNQVVQAAGHSPAGWGAPQTLSFLDGNADDPSVAFDAAGDTLAVWQTTVDVEGSFRPAGDAWQRPVAISAPTSYTLPVLAMNAAGDAVAGWGGFHDGSYPVGVSLFLPGSSWQAATELADRGDPQPEPAVAVDAAGDALLAWPQYTGGGPGPVQYALSTEIYDAGGPLLHAAYNLRRPTISGSPHPGRRLTCHPGGWSGAGPLRYAYGWVLGARTVGNAQRYVIKRRDTGKLLACQVTAMNALGSTTAGSERVRIYR